MRIYAIVFAVAATALHAEDRPRLRDLGVTIGTLAIGPLNAITDVEGVRVGHTTIVRGENVRTGVTAILPHGGNLFQEKVAGAGEVGQRVGENAGATQAEGRGRVEGPHIHPPPPAAPPVPAALSAILLPPT